MKVEVEAISGSTSAQQLRRARARRFVRQILLWVVVPTFLAIIYYGFLASPQYQSVAIVAVQSNAGGKSTSDKRDAMMVREYSLSRTMLDRLNTEHQFKESYQSDNNDFWTRLASDASNEELYQYYLDKVGAKYESSSGTLHLKVRAFSPEAAQAFNLAIIKAAEEMSNAMYERSSKDRIEFAEGVLQGAEERLGKARQALSGLQASGDASLDATVQQPAKATARLEPAIFERDVAQKSYEVASDALEKARVEVLRERRYVVTISPPSLPSGAIHPRRLWGIATVFVLSIVLMGVITMLAAAVREHARF